jgi:hypothetical protein
MRLGWSRALRSRHHRRLFAAVVLFQKCLAFSALLSDPCVDRAARGTTWKRGSNFELAVAKSTRVCSVGWRGTTYSWNPWPVIKWRRRSRGMKHPGERTDPAPSTPGMRPVGQHRRRPRDAASAPDLGWPPATSAASEGQRFARIVKRGRWWGSGQTDGVGGSPEGRRAINCRICRVSGARVRCQERRYGRR